MLHTIPFNDSIQYWYRNEIQEPDRIGILKQSSDFYYGTFLNDKIHGVGTIRLNSCEIIGEFSNGMVGPRGSISYQNGNTYIGEIDSQFRPCGLGVFMDPSKTISAGVFLNGILHGPGRRFYYDGDIYTGMFRHGQRDGSGALSRAPSLDSQVSYSFDGIWCADDCIEPHVKGDDLDQNLEAAVESCTDALNLANEIQASVVVAAKHFKKRTLQIESKKKIIGLEVKQMHSRVLPSFDDSPVLPKTNRQVKSRGVSPDSPEIKGQTGSREGQNKISAPVTVEKNIIESDFVEREDEEDEDDIPPPPPPPAFNVAVAFEKYKRFCRLPETSQVEEFQTHPNRAGRRRPVAPSLIARNHLLAREQETTIGGCDSDDGIPQSYVNANKQCTTKRNLDSEAVPNVLLSDKQYVMLWQALHPNHPVTLRRFQGAQKSDNHDVLSEGASSSSDGDTSLNVLQSFSALGRTNDDEENDGVVYDVPPVFDHDRRYFEERLTPLYQQSEHDYYSIGNTPEYWNNDGKHYNKRPVQKSPILFNNNGEHYWSETSESAPVFLDKYGAYYTNEYFRNAPVMLNSQGKYYKSPSEKHSRPRPQVRPPSPPKRKPLPPSRLPYPPEAKHS